MKNKIQCQKYSKEDDVYDSERTNVTEALIFCFGERSMELICDKACHTRDDRAESSEVRTDDERLAVLGEGA